MARCKVKLQRIINDSTRRATFRKRRNGLLKKARELATLCNVDACVVVYGEGETQAAVWPDVEKVAQVLTRFKEMPDLDQCKKSMDMEDLLTQRLGKAKEQLSKAQRENQALETKLHLHDCIVGRRPGLRGLSVQEITALRWNVENRLAVVNQSIKRHHQVQAAARAAAAEKGKQPLGQPQDNVIVPPTTLHQLQMPPQVGLQAPLVPNNIGGGPAGQMDGVHHQAPPQLNPQPQQQPQEISSWLMDMASNGGDLGALFCSGFGGGNGGSFGGAGGSSTNGAGTSAGATDMLRHLGNFGAGFGWPHPAGAGASSAGFGHGGSFGGAGGSNTNGVGGFSTNGTGTSAGATDMLSHLGNFGAGFGWPHAAGAGASSAGFGHGGSFGGAGGYSTSGAGTSAGAADMLLQQGNFGAGFGRPNLDGAGSSGAADMLPQQGNFGAGFGWSDPAGAGPSHFPPM